MSWVRAPSATPKNLDELTAIIGTPILHVAKFGTKDRISELSPHHHDAGFFALGCVSTGAQMPAWVQSWIDQAAPFVVTHPGLMLSTLVFGFIVGFVVNARIARAERDGMKSQLGARDERINGFKESIERLEESLSRARDETSATRRLAGLDAPLPNRYEAMGNADLRACALVIVHGMQSLIAEARQTQPLQTIQFDPQMTQEARHVESQRYTGQIIRHSQETMDAYARRYRGEASLVFEIMMRRGARAGNWLLRDPARVILDPVNSLGIEEAAKAITNAALTLPE